MPTITTRKIATVAGLGLSSVLLASNASADVDTSTYPKDIQGLLTEAKQLGLEIVQEPQETITTSGGGLVRITKSSVQSYQPLLKTLGRSSLRTMKR